MACHQFVKHQSESSMMRDVTIHLNCTYLMLQIFSLPINNCFISWVWVNSSQAKGFFSANWSILLLEVIQARMLTQVYSNFNCRYRWEFDGKPAEGVAYTSDPVNGTLTITGFTEREEGSYQCFAENEAAPSTIVAAMSPVITLRLISKCSL